MATAFNLTAQINLRSPSNVRNIVSDIRRQLGTISADVNVRINPTNTRNIAGLSRALADLNNNLTATANNANNAANAIRQFGGAVSSIGNSAAGLNRNLTNTGAAANNAAAGMRNAATQTSATSTEMVEFGRTAGLAVRRFAAFSMSAGVIMGLTNAVRKGVEAFIEYDRQFVKLQQVTGESASGLSQLSNTITQLSTSLGVSSAELTGVASTLAQAGLTARDTERALKALALSSLAPSFDTMNQTVEGSIALMRQFGIGANDLEKALGAVNAVSAKFAVEAGDIIAAIQRTGGVFSSASKGVSEGTDALNEFIAVFTSVRATTRESAETIATGLRTIFTRIQRGGTIEALKEFGVNLTDAEGKFVGAYKAVQLLSEGLNQIDPRDLKFSEIVEELGGFRQIGKVIPLIQQFTTAQQALAVAQAGQTSLTDDAVIAQLSLANQAAKVREQFLALFREIGGSDTFQALAKGALGLASALISVADSVKGILPVLAIMTAFKGASAIRQFGTGFMRGISPGGGQRANLGGKIRRYKAGGNVEMPVALTPGEAVFYPEQVADMGTATLRRMNRADKNGYRQKRARGGGVSIVPGQGNTDSFYTTLPAGSFVIRKKATEALGLNQRKGFAVGGTVSDLGGSLVRSSVRETSFTYDKEVGEKFRTVGSEPTKFNTRDKYKYNKINRPINVDTMYSDAEKKTNPVYKEYMGLSTNARYGGSKGIRGNSARNRGYAFEKVLQDRIKNLSLENKATNEFSRLDGTIGPNVFEAKSEKDALVDKSLSEKMVSAALSNKSKSEKNLSNRLTSNQLNNKPNTIDLGSVILFQDTTRGLGQATATETKKKSKKPTKAKAFGGYVQKLMAGSFVKKSKAGRKTREILSDITMADVAKYPASKIIGELGAEEIDKILTSAGVFGIPANKFLRQYKLDPAQQKAKQLVASKYVEKINAKAAANRVEGSQATASATSRGALFGAIGMFGSSFPPEDLQIITDPEKSPTTVRVFGAVLDKNKAAKNARLQEREQRLQGINTKRALKGKSELLDTRAIDIKAAPTAAGLSKQYLKEDLSGVTKRTNQTIIKSVLNALSGGSGTKAFFDFDKTLAFRTNPLGYKEEKLKKGQKSKNPDYTAFGDMSKVEKGLLKAKPSMLLLKLAKLVSTTRQKMPDQLGTLLSNMNVVTARPQNTMGAIGSWLASKGVPVPLNNIRGVGGTGVSSKDVAVAKANTILGMAGSSSSLFVDDDATNIAASQQAGIRSYSYGAKLPLTKAVKKTMADSQGSKFQNDITSNLAQTPEGKRLLQAMDNDTQQRSIDFPYGIGSNLATNWFNNPLLARIPVDAKRTLTGPRAKISDNIKNFLKARGFASGGMVQKLADGDFVEHGGVRYSNEDVANTAKKLGLSFEQLRDEMQDRKTTGFKDYTMSPKRLGELRKLGLSVYKGIPSVAQQAFSAANPTTNLDINPNKRRGFGESRSSFQGRRGYTKGDVVRDPKDTLRKYFEKSSHLQAGERHKGMLRSAGRDEQANRKKDMKKLETPAPPVLYNSLSRAGFDSMAMQVGLNKNPEFPPGTKYFDQEKYYDQEVAKISGRTFKLPGYLSTSANNNKAKLFLDNSKRNKDGWGSFMKILTKPKAKAVDVVKQLEGRKVGGVKKDKLTGQTLYQKSPESEEEFILRPNSRFKINSARFHRPGTNKNIWMDVQQFNKGGTPSLYKSDKDKKAGYDPKKLAAFLGASPVTTDKQKKLADMLNDGKIEKPNYEELLKKSRGYAAGGEIPIMAQEGEYVINKNSAQDIGYHNLEKFNKGGLTALKKLPKYHSGGVVQKFAEGSTVRPLESGQYVRRGRTYDTRAGTLGVSEATAQADALRQKEEQMRRRVRERQQRRTQMAESTPQGQALRRDVTQEGNKRIQTIQNKYGTNIANLDERIAKIKQVALKKLGVSLSDGEAMNQLIKMQLKSDQEIAQAKKTAAMQYKQGLKAIESDVSGTQSPIGGTPRGGARGRRIDREAAAKQERLSEAKQKRSGGLKGVVREAGLRTRDFVSRVAPDALKSAGLMPLDPREKAIADQRKASRAIAPVAAGRRSSSLMRTLTQNDHFQALNPVAGESPVEKARRQAAKKQALIDAGYGKNAAGSQNILTGNQARKSGGRFSGKGGEGGGRGGNQGTGMNRAMMASFMIPMITDMFSGGTPTTTSGAYSQTATQGVATSVGSSIMMGSMVKDMTEGMGGIAGLAAPALMAVTAVVGMTKAFIDAENAAREMAISLASKNLETSLETTGKAFEEFKKDMKNEVKQRVVEQQISKSTGMADQLQTEKSKARRGFANLLDTGEGSSERSDILFEKGMGDYFSATFGGGAAEKQQKLFATMIPKKSAEAAKDYTGTAQISSQLIEEKIRSGTQIKDVAGTPDFNKLTRSLALADAAVQEQILNIQNSIGLTQEEKNAKKESIISIEGERKAREIQTTTLKQMKLEELSKSANHLQNSLTRMFQNMEQAIGRNVFELNNLSQQAELSAAALSGNAKAGQISLKSINVLQNPNAYNKADRASAVQSGANMFGSESGDMKGLLKAGGTLQDTIMSTINKTIKEDPNAGNEKIGIKIQNNIEEALTKLKLPKDINNKLSQEVNAAIGQIRQKGDEKIDFGDLMEKIPQLGNIMDSTRKAQEAAIKALEHWQNNLNEYSNAMNQMVESSIEANSRFRRASDIQVRGQMELDKALGKEISLRKQLDVALAGVKTQTGGQTNPALIAQNVRTLETQRATQQSMSNTAGARGYTGGDEFMMMQDRLRNTNVALRENYDALKNMADNTEMASLAMAKINEIQQKRQAGVNMAERLVTSSPQELSQLNRAMDRLSNNMQGGINFGSSADQRKESLDAFNMIAPFLGEKQNETKANVLESMLMESGVGVNPMMAEVLQSLRNPEGDPEMQQAIAAYNNAVSIQALANTELGNIARAMNQNTADIAAAKLVSAMKGVPFTFENAQLKDIASEIKQIRQIVEKNPAAMAPGKANGGIIYASAGQMVNFQPKGTDTVPAMLTPGEFVVNRSATQRNLPLLKNINSGGYSHGGKVKYYEDGGYVVDGQFAPKDAAKNASESFARTSIVEKESNKEYPIINDNKPLSADAVKDKTEQWSTFKGRFYAAEPLPRNNILVSQKGAVRSGTYNGSFTYSGSPTFNTIPVLGDGYDSVKQDKRGEVTFGAINEGGVVFWDGIPKKDTFDQDIFNPTNPNTRKIKETERPDVLANLNTILGSKTNPLLMPVTIKGEEVILDGHKISLKTPSKVPSLNPSFTSYADGSAEIKGLASKDDNYYGLVRSGDRSDLYAKAGDSPVGNIIGFGAQRRNATRWTYGFGGPAVVSGPENFTRAFGLNHLRGEGETYKYYPPKSGSTVGAMSNYSAVIQEYQKDTIPTLQLAQNIRLAILAYQDALLSEKFESETKESLGNKQNVSDLVNLYNGNVASVKLDKPVIEPSAMAGSPSAPITAYNQAIGGRWTEYQAKLAALNEKKIKDKEQTFQYSDEEKTDMLGIDKGGVVKHFRWTDSNFSLDDYNSIFGEEAAALTQAPVITSPGNYDKNGVKFSYIKYDPKSRLYLETEKRFGQSFEELGVTDPNVIIPPQGNDETMRPFNPFLGIAEYLAPSYPENGLESWINSILENEQDNISKPDFSSNGIPNSIIYENDETRGYMSQSFIGFEKFEKFFKARKENMEKIKNETALSYAKTDFNIGEYAKVDEAKRVTLAREFYNLAKDGDDVPALVKASIGKEITSVADIGNTAISIGSKVPTNLVQGNYEREKIDAWRAVFADLYLKKDARTLQDLGINMSDGSFDGYDKVEEPDGLGDMYTKYWDGMNVSQDLLNQIVNRQIMSNMTGRTSTQFRQNEADELTGDSYTFGTKGAGKIETAEQALPDSWNRLREVALDPQRIFPSYTDRHQLIEKLIKFYDLGKNQYGDPLLPDNLKKEKIERLDSIDTYFWGFDKLVNTKLKTGESDDADAKSPWEYTNSYDYKYFADSLRAISSDDGKANWNSFSKTYKEFLNLETGRDILHVDQVEALIRASANLKEEQQKKNDQNQEGAGNQFSGVKNFATGGRVPVYAKNGTLVNYQPRGTDTVPAMLTPGEFVINRAATQKHLPVLKAINEGHYSRGGIAKYLSGGGVISPNYYETAGNVSANNQMFSLSSFMGDIVGQITSAITLGIQNISSGLSGSSTTTTNGVSSIDSDTLSKISEFTNKLKSVADTLAGLSAIPQEITITVTHTHNMIINGDSALNKLSPDLQEIAMSVVREKFAELAAANQIAGSPMINPYQV